MLENRDGSNVVMLESWSRREHGFLEITLSHQPPPENLRSVLEPDALTV